MDLSNLCAAARSITQDVGNFLMEELGKVEPNQIEEKGLNSLVSYVDQEAERRLVTGLKTLLPAASFLTEEETMAQSEAHYQWIIDPLDGTTNFLFGLPCFAISVALCEAGIPILGIVLEPNRQECFYAWRNGGAYCNGKPISVRQNSSIETALFATGFPYYDYKRWPAYSKVFEHLVHNSRGIRRYGAAAVDLAYVAAGRYDGFYEYSLHPWDVAAGIVLVQEAGGKVADFRLGDDYLHGKEIIASSSAIFPHFSKLVYEAFEG